MATKNILAPDLGGATDVEVIEVLVKVGDTLSVDTSIATLESDKATLEVPASDAGIVKEIKIKVGDKINSGAILLTIEASDAGSSTKDTPTAPVKSASPENVKQSKPPVAEKVAEPVAQAPETTNGVHAGPAVRRLARELGINLTEVNGSGPKQRILKDDVNAFIKNKLTQSPAGGFSLPQVPQIDFSKFGDIESKPLSRIKKISGKNLQRNWVTIPHVTQFASADITELETFRQLQKATLEKQNIKITPLVFIMKAVVVSLKKFPQFNASLDASGENLIYKKYFHIGVAVDTPEGLVVPVIRDVDKKGLSELAKELAVVSEKARNKQLAPGDMQGGTFSISSLGGIGGTAFTPIINAPEVAILGVSKSSQQPVYEQGQFVPRLMLPLSLSYDHRVIDGADGARFITYLTSVLSDIRNLLL